MIALPFVLKLSLKTRVAHTSVEAVLLEIYTEVHVIYSCNMNFIFSKFIPNLNMSTNFNETA